VPTCSTTSSRHGRSPGAGCRSTTRSDLTSRWGTCPLLSTGGSWKPKTPISNGPLDGEGYEDIESNWIWLAEYAGKHTYMIIDNQKIYEVHYSEPATSNYLFDSRNWENFPFYNWGFFVVPPE